LEAKEFMQHDLTSRYAQLLANGHLLASPQDSEYVVHLYFLDKFYVELRLDPVKYAVVSAEIFDESHPRYALYMENIGVDSH